MCCIFRSKRYLFFAPTHVLLHPSSGIIFCYIIGKKRHQARSILLYNCSMGWGNGFGAFFYCLKNIMHHAKENQKKALKTALCIGVLFFIISLFIQPSEKIISNWWWWALLYGIIFYYAFRSVFNAWLDRNKIELFQYTIGLMSWMFLPLYRIFIAILHYNNKAEKNTPFFNIQFHKRTRSFGRFMVYVRWVLITYAILHNSI